MLASTVILLANANAAFAQGAAPAATPAVPNLPDPVRTPIVSPSTTILPTDVLPLPTVQNRLTFGENLQLRMLQKLPSNFYFTSSVEASFRYETNVFQFPTKRAMLRRLPSPQQQQNLTAAERSQMSQILSRVGAEDIVFRVLPNVTGGFTLTPRTRVFANYFMIRDQLQKNTVLNTVIHSVAGGIQRDFPIGSRANLQAEMQFRELFQLHQDPVFDFLPALTASVVVTPRLVAFANVLVQLRGLKPFQAPTREIDPFYTWGALYQRNGWNFSASSTLVQNFREPFAGNASIPQNNYAFILDFEVARRLMRQMPGLQAFVRAEPIINFHSKNTPGLAGTDFRLFWGLRFAATKPSLMAGLQQLKQQIEEQEGDPPEPQTAPSKPSAMLMPYQLIAASQQPMHGLIELPDEISVEECTATGLPSHEFDSPASSEIETGPVVAVEPEGSQNEVQNVSHEESRLVAHADQEMKAEPVEQPAEESFRQSEERPVIFVKM